MVKERFKDGAIYTGQTKNGQRHGRGKFCYADGGIYDGDWKQGQMDGFGKLFYPNEKLAYEGQWRNNAFYGQGSVFNEEPVPIQFSFDYSNFDFLQEHWERYDGNFVDDCKQGFGTLYLINGEKFVGSFLKDEIHGSGEFYKLNGEVVKGAWQNNKLVS
jgi:hypothetical protein